MKDIGKQKGHPEIRNEINHI